MENILLEQLAGSQISCLSWNLMSHNPIYTNPPLYSILPSLHPQHPFIHNRCRYQSVTQQYLKRCLINDDSNYMFRPTAGIIRFSSESMVVVLYRIGMVMSRRWDLIICDVCYMLLLRDTGGGWGLSVMCAILGCTAQVCLLAAR